ncbi:MAG: efflux RND transporter permease subunit [Spirochaetaceae bacterium]|jgi:multidrug efflux pump subunit AcrB|nr:efflux RND transporter permease subunit [Spirochaetaceae bacterium]
MTGKPKRALCIILGLCTAAFFIIEVWGKNTQAAQSAADETFTVTQRFYGVDAAEMERIAAIPLEDALSGIRGIRRIASSSENGKARVRAFFEGREQGRYEAVREAAQRVYESLPSSAQRPEISSSGDSRVPVWTAAVTSRVNAGTILEKAVKPALEGLPGAGEVEISGAGLTEIVITLKSEEAAARKIDVQDIAAVLAYNDVLLPGGSVRKNRLEIPVIVDGRYDCSIETASTGIEELRHALIPIQDNSGGRSFARLADIAQVSEQERDYESRSRLDGKKAALIAVMGSGSADLIKLSARIKEELAQFPELECTVLSDRGEEERRARSSVLGAALQGSCMVALLCAFVCFRKPDSSLGVPKSPLQKILLCLDNRNSLRMAMICSLTVPLVIFFSAALLILLGFSLDKLVLAGIAVGVGAAVDAAILCAEYFRSCKTIEEGRTAMEALRFPLASGAITTVIALLPLMTRKESGINSVAWSIASVNSIAMLLSLTLLPPLFLWGCPIEAKWKAPDYSFNARLNAFPFTGAVLFLNRLRRFYRRSLALLLRLLFPKRIFVAVFWLMLGVLGITALCLNGADARQESSEDSIYAQVEFDGGLHSEEVDKLLSAYSVELKKHSGIKNIQSIARTSGGSVLISFNPDMVNSGTVRNLMRSTSVPGGFVYVMESSAEERSWRIRISGDEEKRCRELAAELARICASLPEVYETVFNFKEGSPHLNLLAERERLALNGLSYGAVGQAMRGNIHGPVAYKRINGGGETDVRIRGGDEPKNRKEVLNMFIKGETYPFSLGSVVRAESGTEASSIQREDRRRGAAISIRTAPIDPRKLKAGIMQNVLSALELPPGYTVEFDPEAIKAAEKVSAQGFLFILALLFCYMLLAAFKESFTFPLAVLAVVPPSLSIPAICIALRGQPLNAVSAAAFVAVSGIAVNAAALAADALQHEKPCPSSCYRVFRRRLPVLAATTLTTAAGAVPFLFIKSNAAMIVKTLSMVSALGVAVSALCAITLIPALTAIFPGLLQPYHKKIPIS